MRSFCSHFRTVMKELTLSSSTTISDHEKGVLGLASQATNRQQGVLSPILDNWCMCYRIYYCSKYIIHIIRVVSAEEISDLMVSV